MVRLAWLRRGEAGLVLRERGNDTGTGKYPEDNYVKTTNLGTTNLLYLSVSLYSAHLATYVPWTLSRIFRGGGL